MPGPAAGPIVVGAYELAVAASAAVVSTWAYLRSPEGQKAVQETAQAVGQAINDAGEAISDAASSAWDFVASQFGEDVPATQMANVGEEAQAASQANGAEPPTTVQACQTCAAATAEEGTAEEAKQDQTATENTSTGQATAEGEIKDLPELKDKSPDEIRAELDKRGYKKVPSRDGSGEVWTKECPDGNTSSVRIDDAKVRTPPKGFADEVPHAHKETVSTSKVNNGNYDAPDVRYNDKGIPSTDPREVHIPIGK